MNNLVKIEKGEWTPSLRMERAPQTLANWMTKYISKYGDLEGTPEARLNHCVGTAFASGLSGAGAGKLFWMTQIDANPEKLKSKIDGAIRQLGKIQNNETHGSLGALIQENGTHDIESKRELKNGDIVVKFKSRYSREELKRRALIEEHRRQLEVLNLIPDEIKAKYLPSKSK